MPSRRATPTTPSRSQGALVWLLAGLVFALGLLSVSPKAHAHLHGHDSDEHHSHAPAAHDDAGCAITLFQNGVTTPLDLPRLDTPEYQRISTLPATGDTRLIPISHHRLPPACGPPCIG
jgi:hypothetical protein